MPELPEVESIARFLRPILVGKIIKSLLILRAKNFQGDKSQVIGEKIVSITRHGKYLYFLLENGLTISIHLKMSGQLLFAENKAGKTFPKIIPGSGSNQIPNKHTRVVITFDDDSALFFNDMRAFGWMKIAHNPTHPKGDDVLDSPINLINFYQMLHQSSRTIKSILLDQNIIAGLGNIYINDALFVAGIHPLTLGKNLSKHQCDQLVGAINEVINLALTCKGSSSGDEMYILPDSSKGNYQNFSKVYDKEGKECLNCAGKIVRIKQNGRSSFFCPSCQK